MSKEPENPQAFACASESGYQEGMTLRDYFAGQVLLSSFMGKRTIDTPDGYASTAYELADAMLRARKVEHNG